MERCEHKNKPENFNSMVETDKSDFKTNESLHSAHHQNFVNILNYAH